MITTLHTYPNGRKLLEPFVVPFKKGDLVVIPKGTYVYRFGNSPKSGPSRRRSVVKVDHFSAAYLTDETSSDGVHMIRPKVFWPGSGGYWAHVKLTDEVLEANGLSHQGLEPDVDALHRARYILGYHFGRS